MEVIESPGGSARKRYIYPGMSRETPSEKRFKYRGADIFADSKDTEVCNEKVTELMTQLSSEKKKNGALERRMTFLENLLVPFVVQLKEKITQRQQEKETVLQILRTQKGFEAFSLQSSADVTDPDWFVQLRSKLESAASAAMSSSAGLILDD